jgi:alkanesulfonate monooxygenase SsuD/methylene tetrahydromethanopterin reductase-like flavin-dependent oxidoreductase (luciferase family)
MVANNPLSLDHAAERGLPVFAHGALDAAGALRTVERYEARAGAAGIDARGEVILNRFVFVGRTTEEARRTMREPFMRFLEARAPDLACYLVKTFGADGHSFDFLAREVCVFGDAEHVASRLAALHERAGIAHFLCTFNLITLDHARCVESMRRFAADVVPLLGRAAAATYKLPSLSQPLPEVMTS